MSNICVRCKDALTRLPGQEFSQPLEDVWLLMKDYSIKPTEALFATSTTCFICVSVCQIVGKDLLMEAGWGDDRKVVYRIFGHGNEKDHNRGMSVHLRWTTNGVSKSCQIVTFRLAEISAGLVINYDRGGSTSSQIALRLAYDWYTSCQASHQACKVPHKVAWCPSRLIDIGLHYESKWKLETFPNSTETLEYITLSYRWGSASFMRLTRFNIADLHSGRDSADLPLTFREAFFVARWFKIRYIWIDSLCIIQDLKEDWETESSQMLSIYKNSVFNIAAGSSLDPDGGLFRSRTQEDIAIHTVSTNAFKDVPENLMINDEHVWNHRVLSSPLHQRGWVLQERLVATRTLNFTDQQIFWQCTTHQASETFPTGISTHPYSLKYFGPYYRHEIQVPRPLFQRALLACNEYKSHSEKAMDSWDTIIANYSICALTKEEDKLVALSGLARMYHEITGDEYLAGLWKSHLFYCLKWYTLSPQKKPKGEYRAPSWSWASVNSPVQNELLPKYYTTVVDLARCLDAQVVTSKRNPYGQVSGGFLVLDALVNSMDGENRDSFALCPLYLNGQLTYFHVFPDTLNDDLEVSADTYWVPLTCRYDSEYFKIHKRSCDVRVVGILVKELKDRENVFVRVGAFRVSIDKGDKSVGDRLEAFGARLDEELGVVQDYNVGVGSRREIKMI